ncbi:uncharacterized protein E5676_scaffold45G00040 [Cucumis melo var. makuwa]|uniref:MULE transposase domain-containing protein n=1 Tax=Cucumis melo var. makuwa TaxID=1194695 RepID=A0A5A7UE52_CUCMM|nr:uncharacterized protein E6C27_scaffold131G002410 [Cucumis melo var. makuwa]TYK14973.1 uncharacterized protein E5676_scaffold45G00040 [Cucumis melo var. makuwa]
MSLRPEDLVILEPGNHGDSDIDVEVDELFGNEENIEDENERIPSEIFTQIDWDITNSICEQRSTLANRDESVDTSCLIQKGMLFNCKEDLQLAVKKLRGSRRKSHELFEISLLEGEHSCLYSNLTQDHSRLDSNFMSIEIQNIVKADPIVTVSVLMGMIKQQYGYTVKYRQVWQTKRKALVAVFGDWVKSYNELPYWLSVIVHYNPGTRVDWFFLPFDVPRTTIFGRVFWAFGPAVEGCKYCRPFIQIDGTHLYGKYKGKTLTALSSDANGHIFPLAFAIVEGENASSWSWFLYALRQYVTNRDGICLISDRHRGTLSAINNEEIG